MDPVYKYKYKNKLSWKNRLMRLLWNVTWALLFRLTPRIGFYGWRAMLLRLFGAKIGSGCHISPSCRIWAPWNLTLGSLVALAEGVECYSVSPIIIGSKVSVSQRAYLCTASHDISTLHLELIHSPIEIDDHAWVCAEAFLGPGVSIGEGAVIAARACVVKDVEPYSVMAGNPARCIRKREIKE